MANPLLSDDDLSPLELGPDSEDDPVDTAVSTTVDRLAMVDTMIESLTLNALQRVPDIRCALRALDQSLDTMRYRDICANARLVQTLVDGLKRDMAAVSTVRAVKQVFE
jgi:hypothetical protein